MSTSTENKPLTLDKKLENYQDQPEHIFPAYVRVWYPDQSESMFVQVLEIPVNEPVPETRYLTVYNDTYYLCWYVNTVQDIYLVKLTMFHVSPLSHPEKHMFVNQLRHIQRLDNTHSIPRQFQNITKRLRNILPNTFPEIITSQALPWIGFRLFDKYYEFKIDLDNVYSLAKIDWVVDGKHTHIVPINNFHSTTTLLQSLLSYCNDTPQRTKIKQFLATITNTKPYQEVYDGDILTDGVQFRYLDKTFYYEFYHEQLLLTQIKPLRQDCHVILSLKELMSYLTQD